MTAAMARNYAAVEASSGTRADIDSCGDVKLLMDTGALPNGYTQTTASSDVTISAGVQVTCGFSTTSNPRLDAVYFGIGTDFAE
jgi:hypothetical protein